MKSLQALPQGTNNVICVHCGAPRHIVGVHLSLVVEEAKDRLFCQACWDLVLGGAWFAFSGHCLDWVFVFGVAIGTVGSSMMTMLPRKLLLLSVVILRNAAEVSPLFSIRSNDNTFRTLLYERRILIKNGKIMPTYVTWAEARVLMQIWWSASMPVLRATILSGNMEDFFQLSFLQSSLFC